MKLITASIILISAASAGALGAFVGGIGGPSLPVAGIGPPGLPPVTINDAIHIDKEPKEFYKGLIINLNAVAPGACEKILIPVPGAQVGYITAIGLPRNLIDEDNALYSQPSVVANDLVEFKRCNVANELNGRALRAWRDQPIIVDVWKPHN